MKAATLRSFMSVHTWVGLVSGLLLFIAFYAGAISVFHEEIEDWRLSSSHAAHVDNVPRAQVLLDQVVLKHPNAHNLTLTLEGAEPVANWYSEDYKQHHRYRLDADGKLTETSPKDSFGHFIVNLHFTAGIPRPIGGYLFGVACILYGLALVSGVIIYAPVLLKDLFALRVGRNLKRFWQDAHNVIGMLSLPFHIIFAWSGAVLTIGFLMLAPFQFLVYENKLLGILERDLNVAPHVEPVEKPAPLLPVSELLARAQAQVPELQPALLTFHEAGDAQAQVTVYGEAAQQHLSRRVGVAMNASTGEVQGVDQPGNYTPGKRFLNALTTLHYGNFGDAPVKWLYLVLGLAGAFLFYSGNLLWIEARRKRMSETQPKRTRFMAALTLGVCLGCVAGVSALFLAGALLTEAMAGPVYFSVFFACVVWAFVRRPARAAIELLSLSAVLTAAIPVAAWLASGESPWSALLHGHSARVLVDISALLMAWAYALLARATLRRGREGDANSVWALPGSKRSEPLPAADAAA